METKLATMEEAAGAVEDGMLLGMTTSILANAPMAFLRDIIRRGVKGIRVATVTGGGLNIDLLIGAGIVEEYETCYCSLGDLGPAPNFQRAIRARRLKLKDNT
jgi:acyl CoA:acetate/3-ketoacid CoA transferase alpha subunit